MHFCIVAIKFSSKNSKMFININTTPDERLYTNYKIKFNFLYPAFPRTYFKSWYFYSNIFINKFKGKYTLKQTKNSLNKTDE